MGMSELTSREIWIAGRYRVLAPIGAGGLGVVYSGWDHELNRPVAIKRVRERADATMQGLIEESFNEGRALAVLRHPHVVRLYDFGMDHAGPYFIMERIDGETLQHRLDRGAVTVAEFCQIARMALEGLSAAHRLGIIHLDMKPSNIILHPMADGRPNLKLLDFGLSRLQKDLSPDPAQEGSVYGTYFYVAPEQIALRPLGPRTDLYSLGHVLYHALVRMPAFSGASVEAVLKMHLNYVPAPIFEVRPDLGLELAAWLHQMMDRDPEKRPESAASAILQLSRAERLQATQARGGRSVSHMAKRTTASIRSFLGGAFGKKEG
jgi:serine/threonine protein kinase